MSSVHVLATGLTDPCSLRLTPDGSAVVVLHRDGALTRVELGSGATTALAPAHLASIALALDPADGSALVAGPSRDIRRVELDGTPDRTLAVRITRPRALALDDHGGLLVATTNKAGQVVRIDRTDGRASRVLARSVSQPTAVLDDPDAHRALVATATGQLLAVATGRTRPSRLPSTFPSNGHPTVLAARPTVVVDGLGDVADVTWRSPALRALLVADRAAGRIVELDLRTTAPAPVEHVTGLADLWAVQAVDADHLVVGSGSDVCVVDLSVEPVTFDVPAEPLFLAAWMRVPVLVNDPGLAFDDLAFRVEPPEAGALVSASRDEGFDPAAPHVVVTAGWLPGDQKLVATHVPSGAEFAAAFTVTDTWTDADSGPSLAVLGATSAGPEAGTWGGGDFTSPQNVGVVPALGRRRVAAVLVDTSDARYPTGAALTAITDAIRDEIVGGVTVGGQQRSLATYFDEASNGAFGVDLVDVVGPVSLPNGWTTYFVDAAKDDDTPPNGTDWFQSSPIGTFASTVIGQVVVANMAAAGAGDPPLLDLSDVDSLVFVVRSVPSFNGGLDRFVWPRASLAATTQLIGLDGLMPRFRAIANVYMPDDWGTRAQSGRRFHETLTHELGHNLQLNDQYFQAASHAATYEPRIADDNPNRSWELMSWEEDLPLPSAAHRLMLGWIRPDQVKLFNFGVFGGVDETFTLHAASAGPVPSGRFAAAEVRISDGRNYYLEYRPATPGRIVDPAPPAGLTVFGSDVTSRGATPADRPEILRLRDDADVDRSEFQAGDDYEEVDTTSPQFPNDFVADVIATTADSATVRVRYGLDQEPDPSLTPWSSATNWQSPDLEVSNARSLADPAFRNVPWEGHDNTVVARVTNRGKIPATGVRVDFGAKDYTLGSGTEVAIGDAVADVGTGATVPFVASSPWRPVQLTLPAPLGGIFGNISYRQHSCVVARIAPYVQGAVVEVTPDNNEAQSNYTWMASTSASPSTREATVVLAENPLPLPADVSIEVNQPHPLFRTYLSHRWVHLEPGESAPILVMVESLVGDPQFAELVEKERRERTRLVTNVRLSALGDTRVGCAPEVIGGASIVAVAGRATRFERFDVRPGVVRGQLVAVDTGKGIDGTAVITLQPDDPAEPERTIDVEVRGGDFVTDLSAHERTVVTGHYFGDHEYGPTESEAVAL